MKAIETRYRGYRFRSRLEAKWAVFFNTLGLEWEYEPEGFELPSGRYLPDFVFRSQVDGKQQHHFVEIKGPAPSALDLRLCDELAASWGCCGLLLQGDPMRFTAWRFFPALAHKGEEGHFAMLQFHVWAFRGFSNRPSGREILHAAEKARSARFEHGETPA